MEFIRNAYLYKQKPNLTHAHDDSYILKHSMTTEQFKERHLAPSLSLCPLFSSSHSKNNFVRNGTELKAMKSYETPKMSTSFFSHGKTMNEK